VPLHNQHAYNYRVTRHEKCSPPDYHLTLDFNQNPELISLQSLYSSMHEEHAHEEKASTACGIALIRVMSARAAFYTYIYITNCWKRAPQCSGSAAKSFNCTRLNQGSVRNLSDSRGNGREGALRTHTIPL
jgi:hypothetical protein